MKLSARNVLPGTITRLKKSPISTLVTIEIAPGVEVMSVITSEGAGSLRLRKGQKAFAIIKASNIMVGVD